MVTITERKYIAVGIEQEGGAMGGWDTRNNTSCRGGDYLVLSAYQP